MEIYKGAGKTGRVYYVLPNIAWNISLYEAENAVKEVARLRKISASKLKIEWVYIKDNELYLEPVRGCIKRIAVVGRSEE